MRESRMVEGKRLVDVVVSAGALALLSPLVAVVAFVVWMQDFHSPFYVAPRVGRGDTTFRMVKFRSMRVGADRSGVDSTSTDDARLTGVGRFLRAFKLDELPQLWNVLRGDMSLVGPRPQVAREVAIYTDAERGLLAVRPGITDFASIVFSDEGEILKGSRDPDLAYNQLIRPWKSRLGLIYTDRRSVALDLHLILLTALALISRRRALRGVARLLERVGADPTVQQVALRQSPLSPCPPPGAAAVVSAR